MRMRNLLVFFGFLVLCACWSPFPNAYERSMQVGRFRPNINTGIAKKVNINGYYVVTHKRVGTFEPFILYSDGTFGNIVFKNRDSLYEQKKQDTDLMQEIISSEKGFCGGGGYYEIKGDTLEVDKVYRYQLRKVLAKKRFKIIDKNHLLFFSGMWVVSKKEDVPDHYDVLYEFVPAKNLPPSTSFGCKLNKYMWENKADWKAYKQRMKQQRTMKSGN